MDLDYEIDRFDFQFRIFNNDLAFMEYFTLILNALGEPYISADDAIITNDGFSAEYGRP